MKDKLTPKNMIGVPVTFHYIMTFVDDNKAYIVNRLEREKRGGTVTKIDNNHYKFSFETYNANDLIPWIRTFICRITDLYISDDEAYGRIKNDLNEMYELYNIGGDEN